MQAFSECHVFEEFSEKCDGEPHQNGLIPMWGKAQNMGQISTEMRTPPGSVLSANQQAEPHETGFALQETGSH
jgi:hypothetical protein